jgi:hypothetical protein
MEVSSVVTYIGLVCGPVGGLVFYLRLSLIFHWCAVGWLENFDDGAPCVAQVETIISVEVVCVQSDLDSLLTRRSMYLVADCTQTTSTEMMVST